MGIPGQTDEEVLDLVRFYSKNRVNRIHVFFLRYYPKTEIAEKFSLTNNSAEDAKPFTVGGNTVTPNLIKLRALFSLLHFLPNWLLNRLLRCKVYKHIPAAPLCFFNACTNITSGLGSDWMMRSRHLKRYVYYITRKLWKKK